MKRGGRADQPRALAGLAWALRLPREARWLAIALLSCAALPAVAALIALRGGGMLAGFVGAYLGAIQLAAVLLAGASVLILERPHSSSPGDYARQLQERLQALQAAFDAEVRRQPREGKEQADDHVPSKP